VIIGSEHPGGQRQNPPRPEGVSPKLPISALRELEIAGYSALSCLELSNFGLKHVMEDERPQALTTIGFDADDTLWQNEQFLP
jgi:hypothetical protein